VDRARAKLIDRARRNGEGERNPWRLDPSEKRDKRGAREREGRSRMRESRKYDIASHNGGVAPSLPRCRVSSDCKAEGIDRYDAVP